MSSNYKADLSEAFCGVIESVAFMFAEPVLNEDLGPADSDCLRATMSFDGSARSGTISIAAPLNLCVDLATNILGLDPGADVGTTEASDALCELANVVCGRFLTNVAGDEPVFNLSIPEMSQLDAASWDEMARDAEALTFVVDDTSPMMVAATLNGSKQ